MNSEINTVIKNFQQAKVQGQMASQTNSNKQIGANIYIAQTLSKKLQREGNHQAPSMSPPSPDNTV